MVSENLKHKDCEYFDGETTTKVIAEKDGKKIRDSISHSSMCQKLRLNIIPNDPACPMVKKRWFLGDNPSKNCERCDYSYEFECDDGYGVSACLFLRNRSYAGDQWRCAFFTPKTHTNCEGCLFKIRDPFDKEENCGLWGHSIYIRGTGCFFKRLRDAHEEADDD